MNQEEKVDEEERGRSRSKGGGRRIKNGDMVRINTTSRVSRKVRGQEEEQG